MLPKWKRQEYQEDNYRRTVTREGVDLYDILCALRYEAQIEQDGRYWFVTLEKG